MARKHSDHVGRLSFLKSPTLVHLYVGSVKPMLLIRGGDVIVVVLRIAGTAAVVGVERNRANRSGSMPKNR